MAKTLETRLRPDAAEPAEPSATESEPETAERVDAALGDMLDRAIECSFGVTDKNAIVGIDSHGPRVYLTARNETRGELLAVMVMDHKPPPAADSERFSAYVVSMGERGGGRTAVADLGRAAVGDTRWTLWEGSISPDRRQALMNDVKMLKRNSRPFSNERLDAVLMADLERRAIRDAEALAKKERTRS